MVMLYDDKSNTNMDDQYARTSAVVQNTPQQRSTSSQMDVDAGRPPAYDSLSGVHIPLETSSPSSFEFQSDQLNIDSIPDPSLTCRRPVLPSLPYSSFPPMYLSANGRHLDQGFPMMPPPSQVQPHPFTSHDVNELDWNRFLMDLQNTVTLSVGDKVKIGLAGMTTFSVAGPCIAKAVKTGLKDRKRKPAGELIDCWNHNFFYTRRMEVILGYGQLRVDSGAGPIPALVGSEDDVTLNKPVGRRQRRGKCGGGDNMRYRLFVVAI